MRRILSALKVNSRPNKVALSSINSQCCQLKATRNLMVIRGLNPINRTNHYTPISIRHFSDGPPNNEDKTEPVDDNTPLTTAKWIEHFNAVVEAYPEPSLYIFIGLRVLTWYAMVGIFTMTPGVGAEFAVGYVMAKFTGKFRQPFNLALAAVISHEYPIFATIKASALMGMIKIKETDSTVIKPPMLVKLEKFADWISGPLDKYGFSYFVASKLNLGILICGVSYAVKNGMDVPGTLAYLGISNDLQNGAGAMGAASLTCVALTPLHLGVLPYVVPGILSYKERFQGNVDTAKDVIDKMKRK